MLKFVHLTHLETLKKQLGMKLSSYHLAFFDRHEHQKDINSAATPRRPAQIRPVSHAGMLTSDANATLRLFAARRTDDMIQLSSVAAKSFNYTRSDAVLCLKPIQSRRSLLSAPPPLLVAELNLFTSLQLLVSLFFDMPVKFTN